MDCLKCHGVGGFDDCCPTCGASDETVTCDRCEGTGEEEVYVLPLKTVKAYLATGRPRGEVIELATMGKFSPDYTQLGRNFGAYIARNCPKAYAQGVLSRLTERV